MTDKLKTTSSSTEPLTGKVEMEELKPCVCGDGHSRIEDCTVDDPAWLIICDNCGMMIEGETRDDAIRNWNEWEVRDLIAKWIDESRTSLESSLSRAQDKETKLRVALEQAVILAEQWIRGEGIKELSAIDLIVLKSLHRLATEDVNEKQEENGNGPN